MRRVLLLASCVLFVLMTFPAQAQAPKCDPASVIKVANGLKSAKNAQKDMTTLLAFRDTITSANIACNGLTFKGSKGEKVLDPITLPDATYRVKGTMKSVQMLGGITSTTISGDCGLIGLLMVFNNDKLSVESTLQTHECRLSIKILADNDWTVTFEPLQ